MTCPYCGFAGGDGRTDSRVIDSRDSESGEATRRRRQCNNCNRRFNTYERVERLGLQVVKKDGRREPYDRDKLEAGVAAACHRRPIPAGATKDLVDGIETDLFGRGLAEIGSRAIGELLMERLRALDEIAYIRFASVYRNFKTVEDFRAALETIGVHAST